MTDKPRESWEALQHAPAAPTDPAREAVAELVMRATSGPDGQALMKWLRSITIEASCKPAAPEPYLRELEAQRHLVHRIEQMAEEGRQAADRRSARKG